MNVATMKPTALALLACLVAATTLASAQGITRWVDKDGKVHYGDGPPPVDAKVSQPKKFNTHNPADDAALALIKSNPVTLYVNNCGELCTNARALLKTRGVPFKEKNPQSDGAAAEELKKASGALQVPTLVVGNANIAGFLAESWNAALDKGGYPRTKPNADAAPVTPKTEPAAAAK